MTDTIENLQQQVTDLEAMLTHASATIARLEGRWRAPGAAKDNQVSLVIEQGSLSRMVAVCLKDGGKEWNALGFKVKILAWHELPPIPSEEGFKDLT